MGVLAGSGRKWSGGSCLSACACCAKLVAYPTSSIRGPSKKRVDLCDQQSEFTPSMLSQLFAYRRRTSEAPGRERSSLYLYLFPFLTRPLQTHARVDSAGRIAVGTAFSSSSSFSFLLLFFV